MKNEIRELSKYRMEKAIDDLETSKIMLSNNKFSQSVNRSYYAMFHAIRSLLTLHEFDSQKHSGIISYFNRNFIKSGKIEVEYSKMLTSAFKIRTDSDYKDFYILTRDDAKKQFENAGKLINRIQEYLNKSEAETD